MAWSLHLLSLKKCYQAVSAWSFRRLVVTFDLLKVSFEHDDDKGDIWAQWWQLWHLVIRIVTFVKTVLQTIEITFQKTSVVLIIMTPLTTDDMDNDIDISCRDWTIDVIENRNPFFLWPSTFTSSCEPGGPSPVNAGGCVWPNGPRSARSLSNQAANYLYSLQEE